MTIARELLEFSQSRPAWQQDLIRRICTQQSLQRSDIEFAFSKLKELHGLGTARDITSSREQKLSSPTPPSTTSDRADELLPLKEEHLSQRAATPQVPVALAAISNVRNANQLAPGQRLPFALEGITLVYGHNGSGKTGYARIVKQLCRARRDKAEPVLGNVYKASSQPAEADITFLNAAEAVTVRWKDGDSPPARLSQISVFDASCAPLYADHQNEIEFLPWGLDVLPVLGQTCQVLAKRLQSEIDGGATGLSVPLPQQISGSSADVLIRRVTPDTPWSKLPSDEEIRHSATWTEVDLTELKRLESELQKLSEPAKAAAQCRRFKATVDAFRNQLLEIDRLLNRGAVTAYEKQFLRAQAAREAASIAGRKRFDADPLGAVVGTAAWQKLYQCAEEFNSMVYPDDAFPAIGGDKVCLLCQQPFSAPAADRMTRFRQFVHDTTQRDARAQEAALNELLRALESSRVPGIAEMDLQFSELSAAEPFFGPVKILFLRFISDASTRRDATIAALRGSASFADSVDLDDGAIAAARDYVARLEQEAKAFDQMTVDSVVTFDLKKKHTELLARRQLNSSLPTILARRAELEKLHRIKECVEQCDTYQISKKNSDFRDRYLTSDFEKEVRKQVGLLGLQYLPIKIDAKTEKGTSYVGVGLNKVVSARTANILSEGEFRTLALACFFAEIAGIPNHDGIVVDDPVSSLDHRHMKQVANRLVAEARTRAQVIVFTHDLSFYYELWSAAAEAGVPVTRNWVQCIPPESFGIVQADDGPWEVKKTKERASMLSNMLMKIPEEGQSLEAYAQDVRSFYTRLRETWERLVEECLLRNVVGRFQPGVQTLSLKGVNVTDEDYSLVYFNMKKASEFSGHDWATGREGVPPSKTDMTRDLAILKGYEAELAKRSRELQTKRRELEQPRKAQTLPPAPPLN